jgi:hypothetical protein
MNTSAALARLKCKYPSDPEPPQEPSSECVPMFTVYLPPGANTSVEPEQAVPQVPQPPLPPL